MSVTLYSTHCPKCKVLEVKMKQKGIEYTVNDDVAYMMNVLHVQSAPSLQVDNGEILDFSAALAWINAQEAKA